MPCRERRLIRLVDVGAGRGVQFLADPCELFESGLDAGAAVAVQGFKGCGCCAPGPLGGGCPPARSARASWKGATIGKGRPLINTFLFNSGVAPSF